MDTAKNRLMKNDAAATIKSAIRNVTIEPCFFLFAMNYGFYIVVSSSLYINKVGTLPDPDRKYCC